MDAKPATVDVIYTCRICSETRLVGLAAGVDAPGNLRCDECGNDTMDPPDPKVEAEHGRWGSPTFDGSESDE